jgi:hypothetical protein
MSLGQCVGMDHSGGREIACVVVVLDRHKVKRKTRNAPQKARKGHSAISAAVAVDVA